MHGSFALMLFQISICETFGNGNTLPQIVDQPGFRKYVRMKMK